MRFRCRRRGRKPVPCKIPKKLEIEQIIPVPVSNPEPIFISQEELIVLKMIDFEGLSQEEVSLRLCISRPKVSRLLNSARRKIALALFEQRPLKIE
jgi:predicted DNA-binding protein (UPF0251 family)